MRHVSPSFTQFAVITLSGVGLWGCVSNTDPPPPPDLADAVVSHYRITAIDLPITTEAAAAYGLDLDLDPARGDGAVDNQLGVMYATMQELGSYYDVAALAPPRLVDDVIWALSTYEADGAAGARVSRATVTDGAVTPIADLDPAIGRSVPGVVRGGQSELPLGTLTDGLGDGEPGWIVASHAAFRVRSIDAGTVVADVAVSVRPSDLAPILLPNLSAFFTDALAAGHSEFAEYADADHDGTVSVDELAANPAIEAALTPDVAIDDDPAQDELSIGLRVTAVAP